MKMKGLSDFLVLAGIVVILVSGSILFSALDEITFSGSIKRFDSCTALATAFSENQNYYGGVWRGDIAPMAATLEDSSTGAGESQKSGDFSETNVQVEGVDEADIVKTDGEYIYTISGQYGGVFYAYEDSKDASQPEGPKLVITKAYPATDMNVVGEIEFGEFSPQEIFIEGDMLMVFGYTHQTFDRPVPVPMEGLAREAMIYPAYMSFMTVKLFDISDRSSPQEVRTLDFEGNYVSSRKIGDTVYFIVNSYPRYEILEDSPGGIIPLYRDSNEGEDFESACGCTDVVHFEPIDAQQFITVVAMSISDPTAEVSKDVIVGSGQNIYMSLDNLFIAETDYPDFVPGVFTVPVAVDIGVAEVEQTTETDSSGPDDEPVPDEPNDDEGVPEPVPQEEREVNTNVHKFSLDGMAISYVGYMNVPGTVLNQFSMDENDGFFRIATTRQPSWWGGSGNRTNNVYVFDSALQRVGSLEGLAPGETIYSARFMGDRGYLVTFKKIDPFFVMDLSDPSNPRVLGKLKIPGYSDYLHPYDENHIIGIGKDTIPAEEETWGRDFSWHQGVKIAIFDVTDVENPVEMDKVVIGDRGTDSEALRTHKAFLFDREKNLLVIPILLAELTEEQKQGEDWQYGDYVYQGAYVYDISLEGGLQLKGRITHVEDQEDFLKSGYYFYSNRSITRSLYINHLLYTISDTMIKANLIEDLDEEARVSF